MTTLPSDPLDEAIALTEIRLETLRNRAEVLSRGVASGRVELYNLWMDTLSEIDWLKGSGRGLSVANPAWTDQPVDKTPPFERVKHAADMRKELLA